jgi:hypothetical protein
MTMATAAPSEKTKHIHVMLTFPDWVRLKQRIAEDDKRVTQFVRDVVLAELDKPRSRPNLAK